MDSEIQPGGDGLYAVCFKNSKESTEEEIKSSFEKYGEVVSIRFAGTNSTGMVFVRYKEYDEAKRCLEGCRKSGEFHVRMARNKKDDDSYQQRRSLSRSAGIFPVPLPPPWWRSNAPVQIPRFPPPEVFNKHIFFGGQNPNYGNEHHPGGRNVNQNAFGPRKPFQKNFQKNNGPHMPGNHQNRPNNARKNQNGPKQNCPHSGRGSDTEKWNSASELADTEKWNSTSELVDTEKWNTDDAQNNGVDDRDSLQNIGGNENEKKNLQSSKTQKSGNNVGSENVNKEVSRSLVDQIESLTIGAIEHDSPTENHVDVVVDTVKDIPPFLNQLDEVPDFIAKTENSPPPVDDLDEIPELVDERPKVFAQEVIIANLHPSIDECDILAVTDHLGLYPLDVSPIEVTKHKLPYCYIYLKTPDEAIEAETLLNGKVLRGRKVRAVRPEKLDEM